MIPIKDYAGGFVTGLVITLLLRPLLRPPTDISYPSFPRHPSSVSSTEWWR